MYTNARFKRLKIIEINITQGTYNDIPSLIIQAVAHWWQFSLVM